MLEYRALAGLSIHDGAEELGVGGPRQRRLLAMLLMHRGAVVSSHLLAEAVFAGDPPPGAPATIRSYVARLRHVIERPDDRSQVVTQPPGYLLQVPDDAFDVARFERSVAIGRSCLAEDDGEAASRALRCGLGLWHGDAYGEFADEGWARPEAQRLGELRLVAHDLAAEADLACGRAAEVATELEVLVAEHPLRESFQAKLMLALYRSGRQVEALRTYQTYRLVLADELGLDPEPELTDLEQRILAHDEALREPTEHDRGATLVGGSHAGHTGPDGAATTVPPAGAASDAERGSPRTGERTGRASRRLTAQLVVLGVAMVVALIAGTVAVRRLDDAEHDGRYAVARELAAASLANLDVDPERSILLALAAVEQTRTAEGSVVPEAVDALRRAVGASRAVLRVPGVGGAVAWSPDGATLAAEAPTGRGTVELRDARTGVVLRSFATHGGGLGELAFAPDGSTLATTGTDRSVRVWDVVSGAELLQVRSTAGEGPRSPSLGAGGSLLAVAWPERDLVEVREVSTGAVVLEVRSVPRPVALAFEPAGPGLAVASGTEATAVVVRLEGEVETVPLAVPSNPLNGITWSPDGTRIAVSSQDDGARILDARTGSVLLTLPSPPGVTAMAWSPDAGRIVTGGTDGTATVWLVDEHGPRRLLHLATQDSRLGIRGLAFSPDGTRVATTDASRVALRVWAVEPTGGQRSAARAGGPEPGSTIDVTADVDELVELARASLTRTLTDDECEQFLHVRPCP